MPTMEPRAGKRSDAMLETFPGLLLVAMIALTLILLPRLNDERPRSADKTRRTEELHIKRIKDE